ncbi:glycosyl hydrolase family 5 [Mycolicibacterium fortuitum subsp. acetamidolyticum]|uniref:Glycosyl hydrolase family 5 n=1 Tax=Mycolicibacterium fortuitum subsp. acetamidolyticum TaxID=144550 RepID=A0A117IEZ4_MYCFO|nr:hypothetical protein [Mycolicibacterium fortuitum]MCV7139812.1 hypothetical protein [Mycolicibacterium fortuitum]GAT03471.1 glycosyl hydrolase family 5 [Mycolicibacterium fortuitum subsp. acetamidolyticum]
MTDTSPEPQEQTVVVSDRETTVAKLAEALSALKTGRQNGEETMGLPAPMRRAAAEGLADLGFRFIEAVATHRVVMPKQTWLGSHAVANVAEVVDDSTMLAALDEFNPELAAQYRAADTQEKKAALREQLSPLVQSTLATGLNLDEAASALRAQGKNEAAAERERRDAKERGE